MLTVRLLFALRGSRYPDERGVYFSFFYYAG